MNQELHTLAYGQKSIEYCILYADRKTLEIAVHPDQSIIVTAPNNADRTIIEQKIKKRIRWIFRQVNYFKQFDPKTPSRKYISGESHLYLGRQYRLKVLQDESNQVKLTRGCFEVITKNKDTSEIKELLEAWYLEKAKIQFEESFERCWPAFEKIGFSKPSLKIRRMEKRWGSLSKKGNLTLNPDLVKTPKECIDYVVIHELCHLKHHNHSPDFYKFLERLLPNWKKVKHKLELSLV